MRRRGLSIRSCGGYEEIPGNSPCRSLLHHFVAKWPLERPRAGSLSCLCLVRDTLPSRQPPDVHLELEEARKPPLKPGKAPSSASLEQPYQTARSPRQLRKRRRQSSLAKMAACFASIKRANGMGAEGTNRLRKRQSVGRRLAAGVIRVLIGGSQQGPHPPASILSAYLVPCRSPLFPLSPTSTV